MNNTDRKQYNRDYYFKVTKARKDKYEKHLADARAYYHNNLEKRTLQNKLYVLKEWVIKFMIMRKNWKLN